MYYQKYYYTFYISENVLILFGYFFKATCLYKHFCKNQNFWKIGMVKNMKFPSLLVILSLLHVEWELKFSREVILTSRFREAPLWHVSLPSLRWPPPHPPPPKKNWFSLSPFPPDLLSSVAEGKLSELSHALWALAGSARLLQHSSSYSFSDLHTQSPLAHFYSLHRLSNSHFKRQQDN